MSRLTLGLTLLVGWVLIWGSVSPGTIIGGIAVIAVMYLIFPSGRPWKPTVSINPVATVRLVAYFTKQVIVSNVRLSIELLRPSADIRSVVVDVPMHTSSPTLLTAVTNFAAMSPGTMVVGTSVEPPVIRAHVLLFGRRDTHAEAVQGIYDLERLTVESFGTDDDRAVYRRIEEVAP